MTRKKKNPQKELREAVAEGYRRLAFGPVGDAVRLMLTEEGEWIDCGKLDLFNLAEIKRGKGTMELKFVSRLEALDRLAGARRRRRLLPGVKSGGPGTVQGGGGEWQSGRTLIRQHKGRGRRPFLPGRWNCLPGGLPGVPGGTGMR